MYCTNCGKEVKTDSRFCTYCGKEILEVEKINIKNKTLNNTIELKTKKNYMIPIALCAFALFVVIAIGANYNKDVLDHRVSTGNTEGLESAIQNGEQTPENYIALAKEDLEQGDIYGAREILKEGYEITQSESLKNVTLWGPKTEFDIVLWDMHILRQVYHFNGDEVKGYQYNRGIISLEKEYYFDTEGKLIGIEICKCHYDSFGGGKYKILCPYDMINISNDNEIVDIQYYEDVSHVDVVSNIAGIVYKYRFYYDEKACTSARILDADGAYTFSYNEIGRITSISCNITWDNYQNVVVTYNDDNSYMVEYTTSSGSGKQTQYDADGRELGGSIIAGQFEWSVVWDEDNVTQVIEDGVDKYKFAYNDNGELSYAKNSEDGFETLAIEYNERGQIHYVHLQTASGEEIKKCYEYSEHGDMSNGYTEYVGAAQISFFNCEYLDNGKLSRIRFKDSMGEYAYDFEYDWLGRKISNEYVGL